MDDHLKLLEELVAIPGPPGQEAAVADYLQRQIAKLGFGSHVDAKGNLVTSLSDRKPRVVVTAHMDEIAMMVKRVEPDGSLRVTPMGGLFPWKLGEGPLEILASGGSVPAVLSFGSIHTDDPKSAAKIASGTGLTWELVKVVTGLPAEDLVSRGVRPGTRVVVAHQRRALFRMGDLVSSYFLDDRADLVSMLLVLEMLKGVQADIAFVATTCEEVGGEGAQFYLQEHRPEYCIALELGPNVEDAPVNLTASPTVWVSDSYSSISAADLELVATVAAELGLDVQYQSLSRGGSDASCSASRGLCARPITLGLPMGNSHGFEIMHSEAIVQLANLTEALVRKLT